MFYLQSFGRKVKRLGMEYTGLDGKDWVKQKIWEG